MRVKYDEMYAEFARVLKKYGFNTQDTALAARLFAEASLDGVYTHGLNRFPKFIKSIEAGSVIVQNRPVREQSFGCLERWNGQKGPGNLNAYICMEQAIKLAKKYGMGCVGLSNTNHWMRPGSYALEAVKHNCITVLWTNTIPNMPPWGAKDAKLGNNPVVIGIPHDNVPVLLDVAMSMFSYGKLEMYRNEGKKLPVPGGTDKNGAVTDDPAAILETHQVFPIGYWKGSGLSLALDLIASVISGGKTSRMVGELPAETELSQIFITFNVDMFPDKDEIKSKIEATLADLKQAAPSGSAQIRYPGEGLQKIRNENQSLGIPVDEKIWAQVCAL